MVPGPSRRLRTIPVPELQADREQYFRIVDDMLRNGGQLIPDPNWLVADAVSQDAETYDIQAALKTVRDEEEYRRKFSRTEALLPAWVGNQMHRASTDAISRYRRFLEGIDLLELWGPNVERQERDLPLLGADLGSIMDLNLLYGFSSSSGRRVTRVLEVGGGYGRLAEAAFNIFGQSIIYVIVDAVPASLYFAKQYLARACPAARIGSFYERGYEGFDLREYDIAIVPSWHFEKLNKLSYDICVNIESFQEMNQAHVDYFLALFQAVTVNDATLYLSNSRDYYFRGAWNYPSNWQKLLCVNTPRSWTSNHPTEILRKTSRDCSRENRIGHSMYQYRVWRENNAEEVISLVTRFARREGLNATVAPLLRRLGGRVARKFCHFS
jgi:hypothetical protein